MKQKRGCKKYRSAFNILFLCLSAWPVPVLEKENNSRVFYCIFGLGYLLMAAARRSASSLRPSRFR